MASKTTARLDGYIDGIWKNFGTDQLTASVEGGTYLGKVTEANFVFTSTASVDPIVFPKPDTFTVYTSGPLAAVTSTQNGVITATMQAGFLRNHALAVDRSALLRFQPIVSG